MKTTKVEFTLMLIALCVMMLCARSLNSAPISVDFEQFQGMDYFSRNPIPESARLNNQLLSTLGVSFTSGSSYVAVVNLGEGHATSGINGIGGSTSDGILTYDSSFPIMVSFFDPVNTSVPAITDLVSVRGDWWGSGISISLNALDIEGNLIDSFATNDTGGVTLQVYTPGIHAVQFFGTIDNAGVALDDLVFNPTTPIPEPATGILLLLGFSVVEAIPRLRRRVTRV